MTKDDVDAVIEVFTPDGTYSAFGDTYPLADFPTLVAAAPKGLFLVGPPVLDVDGDTGSGQQPLCFVDQTTHDMRIGYYTDTYRRTTDGWRLQTRAMTFLRKSGARDSGRAHDPTRPQPTHRVTGVVGRRGRTVDEFRASLDAWLDANADALAVGYEGTGTLDQQMAQLAKVKRLAFDAGWMRFGVARAGRRPRRVDPDPRLPG